MTAPDSAKDPKAVFLDAAGTLFESVTPVAVTYAELAKPFGKNVSYEEISLRFRNCFSTAPPMAFPGAEGQRLRALERAWWHDVVRRIFEPAETFLGFEDYFDELFAYFARPDSWALYDDSLVTLEALKDRNIPIALISNFDSRVLTIIQGLGIADYFDSVFISSSAGFAKPAPEIFFLALERHGIAPHEAIHVGDSPETDVEGALNAGVRPILLDRCDEVRHDGAFRIGGLDELMQVL